MAKQQPKIIFKITPDVRKQIEHLCGALPAVPFIMKDSNGSLIAPKVAVTKFTGTSDHQYLADSNVLEKYRVNLQRGKQTRMRNHKVDLNDFYQRFGQEGIEKYVHYVFKLAESLKKASVKDKIKSLVNG